MVSKSYSMKSELTMRMDGRRVVFVADGRSADTVRQFADHLEDRGGDASHIKQACIDMSPAVISGVTQISPRPRSPSIVSTS